MVLRADQTCDGPDHPLDHLKAGRRPEIEQLRQALSHMSGAERRLRARDHARPGELTTVQLRSLAALARQPEMTAGQLVTGMLDQLEQADIVKRHRSVEDRRVLNVSLTAHGWELLEGKLATWQSMWEEKLADVTDEEIRTGVRVIQQVTELYGEISERLENMEHRETRRG
jgi:DNA-binding MarR family transcriptional regulator